MYLLDTDICSYCIRGGNTALLAKFRYTPASQLFVSSVTAGELLVGIKGLPVSHPRCTDVEMFLASIRVLSRDMDAARAYAHVRNALTNAGRRIGELDTMIAGHALALGAILVTNNTRHFNRIVPPLQLENWAEA